MLESEQLDAAMVVGPPDMHYTCGRACLEAGLPGHWWRTPFRDNAEQRAGYWGQMLAFARAIRLGEPTCPTLWDAYQAMRVCEAMLQSIETGEPIGLFHV